MYGVVDALIEYMARPEFLDEVREYRVRKYRQESKERYDILLGLGVPEDIAADARWDHDWFSFLRMVFFRKARNER